jgi:cytochrome c-type biogenesis protein CcmE
MTEMSWEKPRTSVKIKAPRERSRLALLGFVLMTAMIVMILSATIASGRFFITVDEVLARPELQGKTVKISGAVIGETIRFDPATQTIMFTIVHVPDSIAEIKDNGGLAKILHQAVSDPTLNRLQVVVPNQAMPDLLQNEAQAILTGKLGEDGVFYADELNLKCPSKYESDVPKQA